MRSRTALALVGIALVLLLAGCGANEPSAYQYKWGIFWDSLLRPSPRILNGIWLTVSIAVTSQIIGIILGVFGALGRMAGFWPFRYLATFYVWIFRGTPLLVQITFLYYGLLVTKIYAWPDITLLGITLPAAIQAGIFALGVNEGAYMSEIVRAGILAIDTGQMEAAKSLGMTYPKAMRRIVLPQAARVIIPPLGNEFNNMLKTTSLLTVIAVPELYVTFSQLNGSGSTSFHPFELFLACALWFLLLTTIWSVIQAFIERRLARGVPGGTSTSGPSLRDRLFGTRLSSVEDPSTVSGGR
ncbi:MAG TPA: amino acid ABC transporter permease [Candidatus Limnocylindria bacterium]|jgi:polar amino acid transport system permease protein|nr:amino acid ABC transporter permease [Candidatus Limnocylindria bacterium]